MPTFTFEMPVDDVRVHRRIARNLSLWLRERGVELNHVMTRFVVLDHAYSGPYPLHPVAFARCVVARERDAEFCRALAAHIATILQPEIPPDRIFIHFDPIDPDRHWTGAAALEEGRPDAERRPAG